EIGLVAYVMFFCFFFQAEDGIRDWSVTGVQTWCSSDLKPFGDDLIDLGLVLIGGVEHPGVQSVHRPVAEWLFRGLAQTGNVAVSRDRDVAEDLVGHGALRPRHYRLSSAVNQGDRHRPGGPPAACRDCAGSTPPGLGAATRSARQP